MPEAAAAAVCGIGEHDTKADLSTQHTIKLGESNVGGLVPLRRLRHTCLGQAGGIRGPDLRQIQPQRERHRHLPTSERQRHQGLAVRLLAQHGRILRRHPNRMLALFRQRRVTNDEHRIRATDQSIRLHDKLALERRFVPNAGANKMMEP